MFYLFLNKTYSIKVNGYVGVQFQASLPRRSSKTTKASLYMAMVRFHLNVIDPNSLDKHYRITDNLTQFYLKYRCPVLAYYTTAAIDKECTKCLC